MSAKLGGDLEAVDEGFIFYDVIGDPEVELDGVLHALSCRGDWDDPSPCSYSHE